MSDLEEFREKVRRATVLSTHEQEHICHLHVDAAGRLTDSHWHADDVETPAQRDFREALEAFLREWGNRPKGEPSW